MVLLERQYILGGLAITGLITIYLPLCDGFGHQVSFGIAEELLKLSIQYGAEDLYPANWLDGVGTRTEKDRRYEVQYNAQLFAIVAEKLLLFFREHIDHPRPYYFATADGTPKLRFDNHNVFIENNGIRYDLKGKKLK